MADKKIKVTDPEDAVVIATNKHQTPITKAFLDSMPQEVQEQFLECVSNIDYIKRLISPERPYARDLERDKEGKIIVDITNPHIFENIDYFRPSAKFYEENGCYTFLKPNRNPNSEYYKWFAEERRRCRDGYIREEDGEWMPGYLYWYLNYTIIKKTARDSSTGVFSQIEGFPEFWEGSYNRFHYLDQARKAHQHGIELARRGAGKSYSLASMMSHNLILGENSFSNKRVTTILTAYTKEYLSEKDGTLSKFVPIVDFVARSTEFPRLLLKNSPSDMTWISGYKDANGNSHGSLNSVMGLSIKDDEAKIRGKRGFIFFEEMGSFKSLLATYDNIRDSVKDGENVFSLIYLVGTAGDEDSDFTGAKTLLCNPDGYDVYSVKNVYDFLGKGSQKFGYFFPSYISRSGCISTDGNSDVVAALKSVLTNRYKVKHSADPSSLVSVVAQMPITPSEAIIRVKSSFFPVTALQERLQQLESNPRSYDSVYTGEVVNVGGTVEFRATDDVPIHDWPIRSKPAGAVEIWDLPKKGREGAVQDSRYIIGVDPTVNDSAQDSDSLFCCLVFDLYTDKLVAEFTGRKPLVEDNYDVVYNLAKFYSATVMYESNRKGLYAYFANKHALWMLADCPDYLRARQLVKYSMFGSAIKGISVNEYINSFAADRIKEWLVKTTQVTKKTDDPENPEEQIEVPNIFTIMSPGLLKELIGYGPDTNTDRVSALAQVMLYREQFMINGAMNSSSNTKDDSSDEFLSRDWNNWMSRTGFRT